jgi:hypothetical protein
MDSQRELALSLGLVVATGACGSRKDYRLSVVGKRR